MRYNKIKVDQPNQYSVWWSLLPESQVVLWRYQKDNYDLTIELPRQPIYDNIPIDWDKEMRKGRGD